MSGSWFTHWSGPRLCCCIVVGVGVHWAVLKPVSIYSAWSKTYIWTPRSTFYDVRELSYTLKWLWTMLLALLLVLVYIGRFWNLFQSTQHVQKHISGHQDQPSTMSGSRVTAPRAQAHLEEDQDPVVIGVIVDKNENPSSMMCRCTILLRLPSTSKIHQKMKSVLPKNHLLPLSAQPLWWLRGY